MKIKVIELAELLNVAPFTLSRWEKSGKLIPIREEGRKPYYTGEHLDLIRSGAIGKKYKALLELKGK